MLKKLDILNPEDYTVEERREIVARAIEQEPKRFDMGIFGAWELEEPDCGTVGCIAGWTAWLFDRNSYKDGVVDAVAEKILGLDHDKALYLFFARWRDDKTDLCDITPTEAAAKLRELNNV